MKEMGEDRTEKLEVVPAQISVREDIYKKYACSNKSCDSKPKQAPTRIVAIPRIKATEETLSFIAIQKYLYAMPLYRLEFFFTCLGVTLSRYVMSKWMIKLATALKPIYLTLEEKLLASDYIHIDETKLQVLKEKDRKATTLSYAWVRTTGDPKDPPVTLFHYSPSRSAKIAYSLLEDFKGYVQSDDYEGYACAYKDRVDIQRLLCWDHARRYFWNAYQAIPEKNRKESTSEQILKLIKKLYKIERRIKDLSFDKRLEIRKSESIEVLEEIKKLCDDKLPSLSINSLTAKAILYTLDNWELLLVYAKNPKLNISNSPAERAIRAFVIGRKNWLFSNTAEGAKASMILYSLIITAKQNGLNPYLYIKETLKKIPLIKNTNDLEDLLPINQPG